MQFTNIVINVHMGIRTLISLTNGVMSQNHIAFFVINTGIVSNITLSYGQHRINERTSIIRKAQMPRPHISTIPIDGAPRFLRKHRMRV